MYPQVWMAYTQSLTLGRTQLETVAPHPNLNNPYAGTVNIKIL